MTNIELANFGLKYNFGFWQARALFSNCTNEYNQGNFVSLLSLELYLLSTPNIICFFLYFLKIPLAKVTVIK